MEPIIVGIGEYLTAKGEGRLVSFSLGSCVGVILYDPGTRIAGLAHIMLASSMSSTDKNAMRSPFKYADIGIRSMLRDITDQGALRARIIAKIAGGACMFESVVKDPVFDVGGRNILAVKKVLEEEHIRLVAEDCGKNYGRTLELDVSTGMLTIKGLKVGTKII